MRQSSESTSEVVFSFRLSHLVEHDAQGAGCVCLLYTSDAADERSSVDLGGRRIIKKKKSVKLGYGVWIVEH